MPRARKTKPHATDIIPALPCETGDKPAFKGIHAQFLLDATPEICFEGSRYSGKSWVCCVKVIRSCVKYPGIRWLICRWSNEETKTKIRPLFRDMCRREGVAIEWDAEQNAFLFPEVNGLRSIVFAYGLKSQDIASEVAKVRGLEVAGGWLDQPEEARQVVTEELRFGIRQPGYPHQLIFSPNPPDENFYLADQFPDDNSIPHRKFYRVSLADNRHNISDEKYEELLKLYPQTHARYKSLILGIRGANVTGITVYNDVFKRKQHYAPCHYDETRPVLEAFQSGQHHPSYLAAQRTYWGGLNILGAILGKQMMLEDFMPIVKKYRKQWFPDARFLSCCDPPPAFGSFRYTNIQAFTNAGFQPKFTANGNAHDVREAIIQSLAALMRRPQGAKDGFILNDNVEMFLMASKEIIKHHKFVIDGFESNYVWDAHEVSVSNKKVRQPKADEWTDGAQRCIENIWLNFCAATPSDFELDRARPTETKKYGYSCWQ